MTPQLKKSNIDYKEYRIIKLSNNLKCVLISDVKPVINKEVHNVEGVQKSAAALCIKVGSFEDPAELQGLAHYLEHMVFMGSEKYPTENDFDACVTQFGGGSNAWTDAERTLFHFDCHLEHFEETLDKFANFFIGPLLLKNSMDREVTAVNSEFEISYSHDGSRFMYLLQTTSKDDSPYRTMNCGNTKSLKTDPQSKNIDVYKYLQEFRKLKYSAHNMTLAVQSRDTLDNIEEYVKRIFSSIPCNDVPKPNMDIYQKPFDTKEFNRYYQVIPVNDVNKLKLTWDMPSVMNLYKSGPYSIIGYIFGHEGVGSLTDFLRKQNYIVELEAGNSGGGYDSTSFNSFFIINLVLTDLGLLNVFNVIEIVFSFINHVREQGIPERLVHEIKQIKANKFRYLEHSEPVDVVETLAQNLHNFGVEDLISGEYLIENINMQSYNHLVSLMTVDKVNIMVCSREFESQTDRQTEWYDVKYNVRDFSEDEKRVWSNPRRIGELDLPMENKFIATNFDLIPIEKEVEFPVNLNQTKYHDLSIYGDMWHLLDKNFRIPKGYIIFYLKSDALIESVLNATLMDLFIFAVNQQLNTKVYDATEAGLNYTVNQSYNNIFISLSGFSDKLPTLFKAIIDHFAEFNLTDTKLNVYKEALKRTYVNKLNRPSPLVRSIFYKLMLPNEHLDLDKLEILKSINVNQIMECAKTIISSTVINSYFHGNISEESCKDCFEYAVERLKLSGATKLKKNNLRNLQNDEVHLRVVSFNKTDKNIAITNNYQIGPATLELQAYNQLLELILSEPCFDYLRTKETLGYAVWILTSMVFGVLSCSVSVQSESCKFSLDHCREKMNHFFDTMSLDILENMSSDAFDEFKESFISTKMTEDTCMSDTKNRYWSEIQSQDYIFNRRTNLAQIVEDMNKQNLIDFFKKHYHDKNNVKKLTIEVDSRDKSQNPSSAEMELEYLQITSDKPSDNIEKVISNSTTYPIVYFNNNY